MGINNKRSSVNHQRSQTIYGSPVETHGPYPQNYTTVVSISIYLKLLYYHTNVPHFRQEVLRMFLLLNDRNVRVLFFYSHSIVTYLFKTLSLKQSIVIITTLVGIMVGIDFII
ncbi:hypothetical protein SAMN05216244_3096 [Sediminibacillus halophilus]|uniref:Uncharacterized protein n=1 Tax=Sediminibacillus halophilus TaxID=482461 RepID=A0A1G9V1X7_9BACI|nr:hypothetical protein SAMN05216244_3096 [Sediminibacillus halophilus]